MEDVIQVTDVSHFFQLEKGTLLMARLELYDLDIPGNKYWKLKYNIEALRREGKEHLVTFGGAYSNHIAATAEASKKYGFSCTGIIRGEKESMVNHTLSRARQLGMSLRFIDRETYRKWKLGMVNLDEFLGFKNYYLLPEGASNTLAVKGCSEIMSHIPGEFDLLACPLGSGSTLAGIAASGKGKEILGFSSLKNGQYMEAEVQRLLEDYKKAVDAKMKESQWRLIHDYHFGGFAKITRELKDFFHDFKKKTGIELDLVYTAKMMFGLRDMLANAEIQSGRKILAMHTGGVQGNRGFDL